jgi:outer membrane lipoprotein-sorting protein
MRNFIVLGASALVLALGVAQASAIPSTEQWQEHLDRMNSTTNQSYGDLRDFRAQAVEQGAQVNDQGPSLYHRGR